MASTGVYARNVQNSPSVSLEKGAYRMHAPPVKRHSKSRPGQAKRPSISPYEKRLGLLIFLLFTATIGSFGAAYYLFKSRCARKVSQVQLKVSDDDPKLPFVPEVVEFEQDGIPKLSHEASGSKYLSYLPHSGFHNQRIAFENALILARILNRTLLVPPVWLGKGVVPYDVYDNLQQNLLQSNKGGMMHCAKQASNPHDSSCVGFQNYTLVTWNWLINVDTLRSEQPLVQRWNMSNEWIMSQLDISSDQVIAWKEADPYQFRLTDKNTDTDLGRFEELISIENLRHVPHRLLQFGTLFGSSRVRLWRHEHWEVRRQVRESLTFSNPLLLRLANSIGALVGGNYVAAHVRLSDGRFASHAEDNVRVTWWRLVHERLMLNVRDALELETRVTGIAEFDPPVLSVDIAAQRHPRPPIQYIPPSLPSPQLRCRPLHRERRYQPLNVPLFISTDIADPASHPVLALFYKTFPCTFSLLDFNSELIALDKLQSGYDGIMLKPFTLPFLDAIIAGKANEVVGTAESTFSQFVVDVLWRQYHGLEIVQRG